MAAAPVVQTAPVPMAGEATDTGGAHLDPVCHMTVGRTIEARTGTQSFYFCADRCR